MKPVKIWIARDNDGRVFIHRKKPKRNTLGGGCYLSYPYREMIDVTNTMFEEMLDKSGKNIISLTINE